MHGAINSRSDNKCISVAKRDKSVWQRAIARARIDY